MIVKSLKQIIIHDYSVISIGLILLKLLG